MKLCEQCEFRETKQGRRLCGTCISQNDREKRPVWYKFKDLRWSAQQREIPFLITWEEWQQCVKTKEGKRYMKHRGRGMDDLTIDRIREDDPYSIATIQVSIKRDNIEKYHKHYGHKVNAIYQKLMADCPF